VVVREVPTLMRPGQFSALTLLAACGLYLLMTLELATAPTHAAWITVGAYFVARVLTIRFNWRTSAIWDDGSGSH
jgi:uncharacterized membrane protein YeiH